VELLIYLFGMFVRQQKLGRVFFEKVQVRLPFPCRREPDFFFVSKGRLDIVKHGFVEGAPDLAVEIVSPDDPDRDYKDKLKEYEHGRIREYWIVDPLQRVVNQFILNKEGKYERAAPRQGKYRSRVLKGFFLREEWLWNAPDMDPLALLE